MDGHRITQIAARGGAETWRRMSATRVGMSALRVRRFCAAADAVLHYRRAARMYRYAPINAEARHESRVRVGAGIGGELCERRDDADIRAVGVGCLLDEELRVVGSRSSLHERTHRAEAVRGEGRRVAIVAHTHRGGTQIAKDTRQGDSATAELGAGEIEHRELAARRNQRVDEHKRAAGAYAVAGEA